MLLGQVDWDGGEFRLIDVRGAAADKLTPGSTLPLAEGQGNGSGNGLLDPEVLSSLAVRSYLAVPLETNAGGGAITVCALASGTGLYTQHHLELLAIAGRLLTYEWESVKWRADLRRLSERMRDPDKTDQLTGLENSACFLESVEREWDVAQKGATESYLIIVELRNLAEVSERHGEALKELLLKDSAEVMEAAIRRSDHAGRMDDNVFGAVLVGCKGREGADAFYTRFEQEVARVTHSRAATLVLSHSVCLLNETESSEAAVEQTLRDARETVPA